MAVIPTDQIPTITKVLKEFESRGYGLAECIEYIHKGNDMSVQDWFDQKELSIEEYKKLMNGTDSEKNAGTVLLTDE